MADDRAALPLRPLGATGLRVTPLCVGCAPLGSMVETFGYDVPVERALATLRAAFASPINFFDTAAIYGDGESERRIGLALRELGGLPPGVVLATKADRDPATGDFSGAQTRRSVEGSLERLGLDHLQLVYIHDVEHSTFEEIMGPGGALEVLKSYQAQGVIGQIGISGGPVDMLIRYVESGAFSVLITHNRFTLLNRSAEPLLDAAHRRGVTIVNAAPYNSGVLIKGGGRFVYRTAPPEIVARVQRMGEIATAYGVPLAAAALQFSLRDPRIASTVVGITRPEQVDETLELARLPIPDALWAALDEIGFDREDLG
ncbi:MAG TPA: aldo/keto reductase [Roseiflexaceae bacterium]|nr:aldo/keto reductase [Roseiflexaceae bacterium]